MTSSEPHAIFCPLLQLSTIPDKLLLSFLSFSLSFKLILPAILSSPDPTGTWKQAVTEWMFSIWEDA